jgi:D-serine dehydratase
MLIRLASLDDKPIAVRDVGLNTWTEADGLAVGQASELAATMMRQLVSGAFTVTDRDLLRDLHLLERSEGLRVEPSAAAGFRGPIWLLESTAGRQYLAEHLLMQRMHSATHVLWTTGGSLVPEEEHRRFSARGWEALLADRRESPVI